MFPKNPSSYCAFFRKLAEHHPAILHNESNERFVQIAQSATPFATWDLREFFKKKNAKTHTSNGSGPRSLIMVLVMMDEDDNREPTQINGSFVLLRKCTRDNREEILSAYDDAHKAGREIIAWLRKYFEINRHLGSWLPDRSNNEAVGPVEPDHQFGWAFNFSYTNKSNVCVKEEMWGEFMPFKESNQVETEDDNS
jgi:hypothetical protein